MNARRLRLQNRIALQIAAGSGGTNSNLHAISAVRAFPVREPDSGRRYTVVSVATTSGLTGWGEAGPGITSSEVSKAQSMLTGKDATSWAMLQTGTALDAGIEMALLDITARAAKAPLYRLLGGPTRGKVRGITSLTGSTDVELEAAMKAGLDQGYRAFEVPLPTTTARNHGQAFHFSVRRRMEALRSAAPEDANFVLRGGGKLVAGDAASMAASLERFHLLWYDEPAPVSNLATLRKIAEESVTPLGFGSSVSEAPMYQELLRAGVADVLRPGLHQAGVSGIRRVGALAETYYVAVAPHHDGGPIATAVALHLAASLPNFFIQHVPLPASARDREMRASLLNAPVEQVRDGFLDLPVGPGMGITVNQGALERYKGEAA
jgi:galactonate dehydratase